MEDCINYKGTLNQDGYGIKTINGKQTRVNRLIYELFHGKIPKDMVVRHTCDNKQCINPEHLIIGTIADNIQDKVDRDLCAKGEKNGASKLKESEVIEIFNNKSESYMKIGKKYNVSDMCVSKIKNMQPWLHITDKLHS